MKGRKGLRNWFNKKEREEEINEYRRGKYKE
jgi:hypothetical protein